MRHRFFEDVGEIDHYLDKISEYINAGAWDCVEEEMDLHIEIAKKQISNLDEEYDFIADQCNDTSDALHLSHTFRNHNTIFPFLRILHKCYEMKNFVIPSYDKEDALECNRALKGWTKEALLELLWPTRIQEQKRRERGGKESAKQRRQENAERDKRLVRRAQGLLEQGIPEHELAGRLAQSFELSPRQIRNILRKHGLIKKRK